MPAAAATIDVETLYASHGDSLQECLQRYTRCSHRAADLAQETFCRDGSLLQSVTFDVNSGAELERSKPVHERPFDFMDLMLRLHVDMFLILPSQLFLGMMGLLLPAAIVSGVVLYGPFTRKLDFDAIRRARSRRVRWLDLHNLLGITPAAWLIVVGAMLTLFGLLSALLGEGGIWWGLSRATLATPLAIIAHFVCVRRINPQRIRSHR